MVKVAQNAVFPCMVSSATSGESITAQILASIRSDVKNLEEKAFHHYKIVLQMADVSRKEMGAMNIQSLLQDMVGQCALLDLYRSKVKELKFKRYSLRGAQFLECRLAICLYRLARGDYIR